MATTRPLTARTLKDLLSDRAALRRDTRSGQLSYEFEGRTTTYNSEFIVNAVARAEKVIERGGTCVKIRCRNDHPWVDFPVLRERVTEKQKRRARKEEREGRG